MLLSVIVPCFNEEKTIELILNKIDKTSFKNKEIIVVNDGSSDNTKEKLDKIEKKLNCEIKIINHNKNLGKGAAINTAINKISGDIAIIQDADLEYDPNDYDKLINPILNNKADVVYGSRFVGSDAKRVLLFWHKMGNSFLTFLSNMFTNLNLTDMETGYKVFRADIIKKISLKEKRFGIEPEITAKIAKLNIRIYEVGISYYGRDYSQGKKITWKDGFSALRCIVKYNLFS
ncbi:glycosyltransferase family 2 protein [Pelagibacteraceae bacterium]|nr:glycosyltransferase family 2 protein [Pelagibacteraceae bacterium]